MISRPSISWGIALLTLATGGHAADESSVRSVALTAPVGGKSGGPLFETVPSAETGLSFTNPIVNDHPLRYLYASAMSTGGVAVGDMDGNGLPDIFLAGGPGSNKLFLQKTPWKFEDATEKAGVGGGDAWAVGVAMVDVDNDRDLDLYVCNYLTPNQLFLNQGTGAMVEAAAPAGVAFVDASHTPSFCDYDGDGDLDLFVLTNRWYRPEGFPNEQTLEITADGKARVLPQWEKYYDAVQTGDGKFETNVVGRPDILARNNGDGTFTVVTEEAGLRHRGHGLSATWFDWNRDGHPDLWVGNDFDDADHLYRNNGDGTFSEATEETVAATTWFSMGADFGDVDGDGWMDYFIADMAGSNHFKQKTAMGDMGSKTWFMLNARPPQLMRNCLFINARNGRFLEAGWLAGVARTNWTWAVRLADLDLDGGLDLYVQAGMSRNFNEKDDPTAREHGPGRTQWDRFQHLPPLKEPNLAYRGRAGLGFDDVSAEWGLNHVGMSYGCAVADLDRDGDLDLISARLDEEVALLRNTSTEHGRILVSFAGRSANRFGAGVQLSAQIGDRLQVREVTLARGYLGQDEAVAHFGLGPARQIDRLTVRWPGGRTQELRGLKAGFHHTVSEPEEAAPGRPASPATPAPLFAASTILADAVHEERAFDDFQREPLLPNQMSHWGPSMAWGDVDGDGDQDLYIGQGKYGNRRLWLNDGGTFKPKESPALGQDFLSEDMGCLFFDADGDRDLDLYVASGGVECDAGSMTLQDRLYLNDGTGTLTAAPEGTLPALRDSSGPVAAADFDADGDLDLFVGGRCVPGAWPTTPRSRLLRNTGGKFTDVTEAVAPALAEPGMVTGAAWADFNGDRAPDLVLCGEWMAPKVFLNAGGRLEPAADTGRDELKGWWNGLTAADIDADGDVDFIATNFGLNTKYHASPKHPAMVYYGDFDASGRGHIVEAEYEAGVVYPVRGRSCSSQAMPFIRQKFSTFRDFAVASLGEIYSEDKLANALKFTASELRSGVFRNDGGARFTFEPLPWEVQASPAFGVATADFNNDGRTDLAIGQNFSHAQVETQPMNGGLSVILLGQPGGGWKTLRPDESGVSVTGDVRAVSVVPLTKAQPLALVFARNQQAPAVYLPAAGTTPKRR
jgi:hypothetical protein